MSSTKILLDMGTYNATTIDPYQGVCGLSLFKNQVDNTVEIQRYLNDCKNFCDVFRNIDDENKAISIDIILYSGIKKLFPNSAERNEWIEKINFVSNTINHVLYCLEHQEKRDGSERENIERSIEILIEMRRLAETRLHKPEEKIFYRF